MCPDCAKDTSRLPVLLSVPFETWRCLWSKGISRGPGWFTYSLPSCILLPELRWTRKIFLERWPWMLGLTWVKIINIPRKKQKEHQFRTVASYFLKGTLTYLGIFASRDWKAVGPPLLTSGSPSDLIPTVGRCRKRFCWFFAKQIRHDEVSQLLLSSVIVKSTLFFLSTKEPVVDWIMQTKTTWNSRGAGSRDLASCPSLDWMS